MIVAVLLGASLEPLSAQLSDRADFLAGRSRECRRCNLTGENFKRRDLSGADLTDANLEDANFHDAKLVGARLGGANLSGANLNKADLSRADLAGANLREAMLYGANLNAAQLTRADLTDAMMGTALYGSLRCRRNEPASNLDRSLHAGSSQGCDRRSYHPAQLPRAQEA